MTRTRKIVLSVIAILVAVPIVLIASAVLWFRAEGETNGSIVSSGVRRNYLLHVPKNYDPSKPTPLVISFHPAASRPDVEREITGWDRFADQNGFIVAYPSGSHVPRVWPLEHTLPSADVRYISDLIDSLQSQYNIDRDRIFADGISNGGTMAFALSCQLGDRVAAVGVVAAPLVMPWDWCKEGRPVPTLMIHGAADPVVPIGGGTSAISPEPFPPVRDSIQKIAKRNGCEAAPQDESVTANVRRASYQRCNADLVFYLVNAGGHTWPGGESPFPEFIVGKTNREIDATRLLWAFYMKHPLQHPTPAK